MGDFTEQQIKVEGNYRTTLFLSYQDTNSATFFISDRYTSFSDNFLDSVLSI
jgi:hypothetical protein